VGPALGAARLAQIAAIQKSLIELLPQLPLEQSHLPDAQRYTAYQPRRETFRRLYQRNFCLRGVNVIPCLTGWDNSHLYISMSN
jgi:sugar (pentulose or hexulose) kinase